MKVCRVKKLPLDIEDLIFEYLGGKKRDFPHFKPDFWRTSYPHKTHLTLFKNVFYGAKSYDFFHPPPIFNDKKYLKLYKKMLDIMEDEMKPYLQKYINNNMLKVYTHGRDNLTDARRVAPLIRQSTTDTDFYFTFDTVKFLFELEFELRDYKLRMGRKVRYTRLN